VPSHATYAEPARPLRAEAGPGAQLENDCLLDLDDLLGGGRVHTALRPSITIRNENLGDFPPTSCFNSLPTKSFVRL